jgi:hypothetical protein
VDAVDRRRQNNVAVIALVVTLLTNVLALVWGAATLNATVNNLLDTVRNQGELQASTTLQVQNLNIRMGIVEDRSLRNTRDIIDERK